MSFSSKPYTLTNVIQNYPWGGRGPAAFIPKLLGMKNVDPSTPFAEIWMGTHPLGTSSLLYQNQQMLLSNLVQQYPAEILGGRVAAAFEDQFPFLLKVLSADETLSIQLHPSKNQAEVLHAKDPSHYPDANHKPEIAIALDALQALAGIREPRQIEAVLVGYPELRSFLRLKAHNRQSKYRLGRVVFAALFQNALDRPREIEAVIQKLVERLRKKQRLDAREKLFLELSGKYPGDVGLLSIFLLKLHRLKKGRAMFIPAGVPHAYLKGNIIECMASSDNVIRVGLTGKFKDIPALLDVFTDKSVVKFSPSAPSFVYPVQTREFRLQKIELKPGRKQQDKSDSVRVLMIVSGKFKLKWGRGKMSAAQGQAILVPASLGVVEIECLEAGECYKADVP
ncbi:MAG: mannose-6-phosphate isomerase, class I [Anaerolineales bacterium]|nr:mannose-6-phosphate isomerase, class I [Anaerolineales bacterium]MBP6209747.1 mannose-6-phosphate isomerase, class I [Anaerolineales bacterium]